MKVVNHVPPLPARPDDAHKGTFGTVVIVGGCPTMIGAPALAASAALRGGVGLAKIAAPAEVVPFAITIEPGATGIVMPPEPGQTITALDQADPNGLAVLAVGPGMGQDETARQRVRILLTGQRSIVLDADGLNHLASTGQARPPAGPALVLTPHPGEFRRLGKPLGIQDDPADPEARPGAAVRLAESHRAIVVLKGRHTVVTDGDRVYVNQTGNPALSTAGTGDVLTGLIAALIAQGLDQFDAAVLGAYLHGLGGDLWRDRYGTSGLTARVLVHLLPEVFEEHRKAVSLP